MNQKKRNMAGAVFGTIMTIAMLMIAASVSGAAVFASNDYVTDYIGPPRHLRFEGPYICWDGSEYQYTYGKDEEDYHSNFDPGLGDEIRYTVEVYESSETELELLESKDVSGTRYDLTDAIKRFRLVDDLGRETGNKMRVKIKARLTSNEGPELESGWNDARPSVPCYIDFKINEDNHFDAYAFEDCTVAEPEDPEDEGRAFLYWADHTGKRWDFSRRVSPDDFSTHHQLILYAKWEDVGAHEHDGTVFLPWRSRNSLPNEAGSYYLLNDVDISGTWNAPQGNTNLCLNGYTVSSQGGHGQDPAISVGGGAALNIYDGSDGAQGKLMMRSGGSAVGVNGGTFILNDATIDGTDKAMTNYGGGVEIEGGTFEMRSGKITNCSAGYGGGGIYVDEGGTFRMKGGEISGNRGGSSGGGVYLRSGKIEIVDGTITDNAASEDGGGIEFYPVDDDDASISFAAESAGEHKINITGNSGGNLYLLNGYKLNINGALSEDSRIGVSIHRPAEYIFTDGLNGNGTAGNFTSDHGGYKIALTEDGKEARLVRNPHQITAAAVEHGSLKAYSNETEITEAIAGESVSLEPEADTGWSLVRDSFKCTYTDAEGNEVAVPVDDYGDFTMPAYDVTVSCEFEETEIEDAVIAALDADGQEMSIDEIEMGQTIQLVLVPYPKTAEVSSVEWSSSDDGSFLTMTEDGKITGVIRDNVDETKTVTITATAKGKNGETVTASRDITVKHTHYWVNAMSAFEATCTQPGNSAPASICENEIYPCYKTIPDDVVITPPLGHDWGEWVVIRDATESEEGEKTHTCARCGKEETVPIPKIEPAPAPSSDSAAAASTSEVLDPSLPKVKNIKPAAGKASLKAKWKKLSKKNKKKVQGIEIQYSADRTFPDGQTGTVSAKKTAKTKKIKKLAKKTTYYTRVRSYKYIGGVKHVSYWSAVKKNKTK